MMKNTDDTKIRMIQFHQSYAYEDFIQGIRPSEKKVSRLKMAFSMIFVKRQNQSLTKSSSL